MTDVKELLKNVYLFKKLSDEELDTIAGLCDKKTYSSGDTVFYENDEAKSLYIVQHCSMQVSKKAAEDDQKINIIGPGMHFGELPFVAEAKRSARVEAAENSTLIEIPYEKLKQALDSDVKLASEVYYSISHFLAARLRKVTTDLSFAREKNLRHF